MKNIFLILFFLTSSVSFSQHNNIDYHDNIDKICNYVKILHDNPERYAEINEMMYNDLSWSLMTDFYDNCICKENVCSIFDDVEITGINDRAYHVELSRGNIPQSSDNFCTGTDIQSNYLFYECSVLTGSRILTSLKDRYGKQLFVVIPFNKECIEVKISLNGNYIAPMTNSNGHICFIFNENVKKDDNIEIEVTNVSDNNQSFVIINHNSL